MPRNADYAHMRCRYCGKELALLKRLTGGGEFCSDAHKQSYQDEYNRLALSRLLQAQKQGHAELPAKKAAAPPPPPSAAPVAVAEPVPEEPLNEELAVNPAMQAEPVEMAGLDEPIAETVEEAAEELSAHPEPETEPEPSEIAEFVLEIPAIVALADEAPLAESWLELTSGPAVVNSQIEPAVCALGGPELLALALPPQASPGEFASAVGNLAIEAFTPKPRQPEMSWKTAEAHALPSFGSASIDIHPMAADFAAEPASAQPLEYEFALSAQDSPLLKLPFTRIEFPAEDAAVQALLEEASQPGEIDSIPGTQTETETALQVEEDDSPRASLEALARLHENLIQADPAPARPEPPAISPSVIPEPQKTPAAEAVAVETKSAPESETAEPTWHPATDLLEVSIRMFPPPKPAPQAGPGLPIQTEPLLPRLKSLPLRPKMAIAHGYSPSGEQAALPPKSVNVPKAASHAAAPPAKENRTPATKTAPATKAASRIAQPKQPAPGAKPGGAWKTTEAAHTEVSKPATKVQAASQASTSKAAVAASIQPETASPEPANGKVAVTPKATTPQEPLAAEKPRDAAPALKPEKPARTESLGTSSLENSSDDFPSFGGIQPAAPSFAGSLKVKLGIAIVILVVACSTWLGWGGKSNKPATSNGTASSDGAGPSIIMGEGGWVEGWAGDPSGVHAGRQITIYRPSLKLSDYRVEFVGSIDSQSIGWVFRAANPDNYYALKLMEVSTGLEPKVALFKYLVINGRQVQVGRVPIDVAARPDTEFNIRTDVHGPQFTTYIQGHQVDTWTDDQLKTGGVGFLNERDERAKVKSVSIRYLNGGK